ncbi:hypothetical protein ACTHGU_08965 [Chitinophagaceae bacterium MMS25-I14]
MAVIRGTLLREGFGNKYYWDTIRVNEIIMNKTRYSFGNTVSVARYNWSKPLPAGKECIIYLTAYPYGSTNFEAGQGWMYLDGDAQVSFGEITKAHN